MTFVDLLQQYDVPIKRHGESSKVTDGWVGLRCPFCQHRSQDGDDNLLGVNLARGAVKCWYCGPHGQAETLAALTEMPYRQALALVMATDRPLLLVDAPRTGKLRIPAGVGPMTAAHKNYLARNRGIDPAYAAKVWGVQGIGVHPRLGWRLFLPITLNGKVVSWTTRTIADRGQSKRYMAAKQLEEESVPRRELLYGEDLVRHSIMVHEGPLDAIATGPGAVATMSLAYTKAQVLRISRYPVRAICFDSEPMAQQRARALADELAGFPGCTTVVELETGADSADASPAERAELRRRFLD